MAVVMAPAYAVGADWLLGAKPVYEDTAPGLGVGRFGLGFGADSQAWPEGRDRWSGGFPSADGGPVGVSLAPGLAYRARPNLALEAGLDVTYRTLRAPGLVPPEAATPGLGGVGLNLGVRYDFDARTQFGVAYRSELRSDPSAMRYYVPRGSILDPGTGRSPASQAFSANVQRQVGSRWSLLGSVGWQQGESPAFRSDAWLAGVGAQYRLQQDLDVGMALEYSTGNGLDARRNFTRDLPASDGGSYFFGLDLNWRF
ncbi:MAG TPA: hypothetical protein VLC55_13635 [Burkholderiales bacterium]|nr:hypothetical protein [Burkholderiales bacterium]